MSAIVRKMALIIVLFALLFSAEAGAVPTERPAGDSWAIKTPMPVARGDLGVAVVDGKVYAIGGGVNQEYDPVTDKWTLRSPMPTLRGWFGIAVYHDKIYCVGGTTRFSGDTGFEATGANQVYDPSTDTWENKASMPTARFYMQASVVDGKIFLIGGVKSDIPQNMTIPHRPNYGRDLSDVVEVYDPFTDMWSTKTSIPVAVSSYVSAVVKNKIYVITPTLNLIYDAENDNWSQGAPPVLPSSRSGGVTSGVFAPQRIYVFSGKVTQSYDLSTDSWSVGSSMITDRMATAVAVLEDRFYVIGGYTDYEAKDPSSQLPTYFNPHPVASALNEEYTPIGYGNAPPEIVVLSPESSVSYNSSTVSLNFTVNKQTDWLGYSLDGQENVTITGNTTIAELLNGQHNVTVYANATYGNTGKSETIPFTIAQPASFPITEATAAVSGASVAVACIGILLYLRKRKQ